MFYLKHKSTGMYFDYDERNNIVWVKDKRSAMSWVRESDALFCQNLWDDADKSYEDCLWMATELVEE